MPTQFGMAIRLDPSKVEDGMPHEDMREAVVNRMTNSIMIEISQRTMSDGRRLVRPRVRIESEPQRLKFDLIGDLDGNDKAIEWMNRNFNSSKFRENLLNGINRVMVHWARKNYEVVLIDQDGLVVEAGSS